MAKNYGKRKKSNKLAMAVIFVMVLFVCLAVSIQAEGKRDELKEKEKQVTELEKQIKDEENKSEDLEEMRIYKDTMMFVEEYARKLGWVYKDEINYRPR